MGGPQPERGSVGERGRRRVEREVERRGEMGGWGDMVGGWCLMGMCCCREDWGFEVLIEEIESLRGSC